MTLVVRTNADPMNLAGAVRTQVLDVDNNQPVYNIRTMEKIVADTRWPQRINMGSLAVLAGISLILAAVGIYGLISYSVNQRTHELGLRMAIGAQQSDILKLVVREGMVLGLIGLAIGLVAALLLTRFMSSLLFGVSATDPFVFVGVSVLLAALALFSSFVPARRAAKVDPMVALRYE